MFDRFRHPLVAVTVALVLTIPWIGTFISYGGYGTVHPGENITPVMAVLVAGFAILGAAFLLAWAAETAEKDVPQAFAIAVLAVLALQWVTFRRSFLVPLRSKQSKQGAM